MVTFSKSLLLFVGLMSISKRRIIMALIVSKHIFMLSSFFSLSSTPKTPMELAIDFILHDFEMAGHSAIRFFFFSF